MDSTLAEEGLAREVYIVDDNLHIRTSLHGLLDSIGIRGFCFGQATDFIDSIEQLAPAPILLDMRMPDVDGLEIMAILRSRSSLCPVIVMTGHGDVPLAVSAMKLGAIDFLQKPFKLDTLEAALNHAFRSLDRQLAANRQRTSMRERLGALTTREREVAEHLGGGASNKAVALRLGLSVRTVEMHRAGAMKKLGVGNIVELAEAIGTLPGNLRLTGAHPVASPAAAARV